MSKITPPDEDDLTKERDQVLEEIVRVAGQIHAHDLPLGASPRFQSALIYAVEIHADQKRKSTEIPYISHLLAVASLVMEAGGNEDEVIGALLHDAAEDQGGLKRLVDIRRRFGENVADIVEGCTDGMPDETGEKAPWKERKLAYIEHLKTASRSVRLVSNADKLHNAIAIERDLSAIGIRVFDRFNQSSEETLWYYRELSKEFLRDPASERLAYALNGVVMTLMAIHGYPED